MRRRPPISTRTDTPLPYPTLFRSQPWVAVPIPDAAKVTRLIDNADAVDVRLSKVIAAQNTSPPASEDRDIDVLDDRGSRNIRHMRIFMLKLRVTFIRSVVLILTIQAHPAVALFLISRAHGRNVNLTGIRKRRGGACHFDQFGSAW